MEELNGLTVPWFLCSLYMYCNDNLDNWYIYLRQVVNAYQSFSHASTMVSPNKIVFGREIFLPLQAMIGRPVELFKLYTTS